MNRRKMVCAVLCICGLAALCGPRTAGADTIIDFLYETTTDSAYNMSVHLRNTGVWVTAGDVVNLLGSEEIYFGGGYYVSTNFDMGLISPSASTELSRVYNREDGFNGEALPLAGESILFRQERVNSTEQHDLLTSVVARSDGYIFLGLWDQYFQDNVGHHTFQISVVPEPSSLCLAGLLGLSAVIRRRR